MAWTDFAVTFQELRAILLLARSSSITQGSFLAFKLRVVAGWLDIRERDFRRSGCMEVGVPSPGTVTLRGLFPFPFTYTLHFLSAVDLSIGGCGVGPTRGPRRSSPLWISRRGFDGVQGLLLSQSSIIPRCSFLAFKWRAVAELARYTRTILSTLNLCGGGCTVAGDGNSDGAPKT
jgi:hypothetical protein